MIINNLQLRVDRFSGRKARHPNLPATQTNLGTIIGDSIVKYIPLTQGKFAIVDDEDYDRISELNWFVMNNQRIFYAGGWSPMVNGKRTHYLMHRIIMDACKGQQIDHKDGNGLNNQRMNLRFCTISQNLQNQRISKHPSKHSKYKGVTWHKSAKKWQASIRGENHRDYYLGSFVNEEDAAKAYDKKAKELFGEFARCNYG